MSACARPVPAARKAAAKSLPLRASTTCSRMDKRLAPAWVSFKGNWEPELVGFLRTGQAQNARHDFFHQLDALCRRVRIDRAQTGDVAARPRQTGDKAGFNRIEGHRKDDRNRLGRLPGGVDRLRAAGDDDIDLETNQLGGKFGETLYAPAGKPILNVNIFSFDVAQLLQPLTKRRVVDRHFNESQVTDAGNFLRLLRLRTSRQKDRQQRADKNKDCSAHSCVLEFFLLFCCQPLSAYCLFSSDDSIRPGEHIGRNRQSDLLGGLEIHYEFKLRRLFDGSLRAWRPSKSCPRKSRRGDRDRQSEDHRPSIHLPRQIDALGTCPGGAA